jgi:hypothetical protein
MVGGDIPALKAPETSEPSRILLEVPVRMDDEDDGADGVGRPTDTPVRLLLLPCG